MKTYDFPMQFEYGMEVVTLSEQDLRDAGFFSMKSDLERELLLWDLADSFQAATIS